ncbi:MAG: flagellar motor protein MotA [Rhodospirillales bacterium]
MTKPGRYLARMAVFLLAVAALIVFMFPVVERAFFNNPYLNGVIITVLVLAIANSLRQVFLLQTDVTWIDGYSRDVAPSAAAAPRLLGPMAAIVGDRQGRLTLSPPVMRTLLDGIASRLDEQREISRYAIGLLIFLGLLGTFWGLLETVNTVGDAISKLQISGDPAVTFAQLKTSLEGPLRGMGTAFSASLFGLAGSLVLGFLDLQAGQAQNRFFNDLEEWLSEKTRLPSAALSFEGDQSVPAYVQALLEQTAESLENLQRIMARAEEGRGSANTSISMLAERLTSLTDFMRHEQQLLGKLAENSVELRGTLGKLAEIGSQGGFGMDEGSRTHIRNIEIYMARMLEEMVTGRTAIADELRGEIKLLARALAARQSDNQRSG